MLGLDRSVGLAEDNIAHENLVFECSSEGTFRSWSFVLDLEESNGSSVIYFTTNSRDRTDLCPFKFGDLKITVEHIFDERRILVDLHRMTKSITGE